jgi:hypothetical protein
MLVKNFLKPFFGRRRVKLVLIKYKIGLLLFHDPKIISCGKNES